MKNSAFVQKEVQVKKEAHKRDEIAFAGGEVYRIKLIPPSL